MTEQRPRSLLFTALLAALIALCGCSTTSNGLNDFDGDGSLDRDDCAPDDATVYPGAATDSFGDNLDSNCDGSDGIDNDLDGYPAPGEGVPADLEDCNDSNPDIHPGTQEIPDDNIDQNCDGFDESNITGAPIITISPLQPRTADDLVATVTWEAGSTVVQWFVDGVEVAGLAAAKTVPAASTQKGQVWRAVASAEVGGETRQGEASVTVHNSPPLTQSVQVLPAVGTVLDSFECFGSNSDADDDPLSYTYRWFIDDQPIDATTSQIDASAGFARGNWLDCEITATDGAEDGTAVASAQSSTILNSPPSTPGAPTPSVDANAYTDEDLLCEASTASTDPDSDALTYTMEWIKSSAQVPSLTAQFAAQDPLLLELSGAMTQRGEEWRCHIGANDGTQLSDSAASATITIINSPPTAPFIETDTAATSAVVTPDQDIRCYIDGASSDADEDTITYHMEWLENGNSIPYENTGATANDDLVLPAASYSDDGDTFTCVVTPNDGLEDGPSGSAVVQVCGDTRIVFENDSDHVRIPKAGTPSYGPEGTIEAWIYLHTLTQAQIFGHWQDGQGDVQIKMDANGRLSAYIWSWTTAIALDSDPGTLTQDQWHHVALQWDTTGVSLWRDGVQVATTTTTVTPATAALSLYLGENGPRAVTWDSSFRGSIQNLRISDVARYSGGPVPRSFGLDSSTVLLYRLDEGSGNALDANMVGQDAIPVPANLWTNDVPCLDP